MASNCQDLGLWSRIRHVDLKWKDRKLASITQVPQQLKETESGFPESRCALTLRVGLLEIFPTLSLLLYEAIVPVHTCHHSHRLAHPSSHYRNEAPKTPCIC